jgi:hypothetical protein
MSNIASLPVRVTRKSVYFDLLGLKISSNSSLESFEGTVVWLKICFSNKLSSLY